MKGDFRNKREHNKINSLDALLEMPREKRFWDNPAESRASLNSGMNYHQVGYSNTTPGNLRRNEQYNEVLEERFDFSGHRKGLTPHVNYGIRGTPNGVLGDAHSIDLPGFTPDDNIGVPSGYQRNVYEDFREADKQAMRLIDKTFYNRD